MLCEASTVEGGLIPNYTPKCQNNSVNFISLTFQATVFPPKKEEFSQHQWGLVPAVSDLPVPTICHGSPLVPPPSDDRCWRGYLFFTGITSLAGWQGGNSTTLFPCSVGFPLTASRVKVSCCLTYWAARKWPVCLLMAFTRGSHLRVILIEFNLSAIEIDDRLTNYNYKLQIFYTPNLENLKTMFFNIIVMFNTMNTTSWIAFEPT